MNGSAQGSAAVCGLSVTSPPADSVIALTDGKYLLPQPGPGERAPLQRSLTVEGTSSAATVTVNGAVVPVAGGAWTTSIPILQSPGAFTITAHDGVGPDVTQSVTLIDLVITSPTENASQALTALPAMPTLNATAQVEGFGGDTTATNFTWTLNAIGNYITRRPPATVGTWVAYNRVVGQQTQTGLTAPFNFAHYSNILGGVGRLSLTATLPGVLDSPVLSEPRWIDMPGSNPPLAAAKAYADAHVQPAFQTVIRHIFCNESLNHSWIQFQPVANRNQPASAAVPADWPQPGPFRPAIGAPAGVGIAQIDPATLINPDQQWNWQANEDGGIATFNTKLASARGWAGREQSRLDHKRAAVLAQANANLQRQGLPPTATVARITVPALTDEQVGRDAVRQYNGGHQYRFDADYVLNPDGTSASATLSNPPAWVEAPGLHWTPSRAPAPGSRTYQAWLTHSVTWTPVARDRLSYLDDVLNCANS